MKRVTNSKYVFGARIWLSRVLGVASVGVLLSGVGLGAHDWERNRQADHNAAQAVAWANADKPSPAPSTTKLSSNALAIYTVAPNMPRYLIIPKLSVDARILPVGLTAGGAIGTPSNVHDTDWYNKSAEPGQPGAMLIDGHVSSWTTHGVFYGLKVLNTGDTVQVARGDGAVFTYKVINSRVYSANKVDMNTVLAPAVAGSPGLNLISCSGDVVQGTNSYNERIVVFTEQVSSTVTTKT
jgi:hypothetical protein